MAKATKKATKKKSTPGLWVSVRGYPSRARTTRGYLRKWPRPRSKKTA